MKGEGLLVKCWVRMNFGGDRRKNGGEEGGCGVVDL